MNVDKDRRPPALRSSLSLLLAGAAGSAGGGSLFASLVDLAVTGFIAALAQEPLDLADQLVAGR